MSYPQLYGIGIRRQAITITSFFLHSLEATYHACVVYYITIYSFADIVISPNGQLSDRTFISVILLLYTMWVMNIAVLFNTNDWTWITVAGTALSIAFTFLYTAVYSTVAKTVGFGLAGYIFTSIHFWLTFIVALGICLLPRLAITYFLRLINPTDTEIAKEIELTLKSGCITKGQVSPECISNYKTGRQSRIEDLNTLQSLSGLPNIAIKPTLSAGSIRSRIDGPQFLSPVAVTPSPLSTERSTLEITDIHHTRESFSIPHQTRALLLPSLKPRRYSLGDSFSLANVSEQHLETRRRGASLYLQKPPSGLIRPDQNE
jgi:Phospholipid-translocating P-type ATPase C-terminal